VNAFAVPGGYIYVSRGVLALSNSEAELASVLAHEVGHITGRHSAARYSQSVLTSLGAIALSTALDSSSASELLGIGSDLYLSSYSRSQEHESDNLGIRYLVRAGYDPFAMSRFMQGLQASTALDTKLEGGNNPSGGVQSYLSTHPQTADRVAMSSQTASQYAKGDDFLGIDSHFKMIDGMIYGESESEGFTRDRRFYHPQLDFTFEVPNGFKIKNLPAQVVATDKYGVISIFDADFATGYNDPATYLRAGWMKNEKLKGLERVKINGKPAATASFDGRVNNKPVTIRLVAVKWKDDQYFRFQIAIPRNASKNKIDQIKAMTYSLRHLTNKEKKTIAPYKIDIVTAKSGDTVSSLASKMPFSDFKEERFRVLNGLYGSNAIQAGKKYKLIRQ
jgi:predicted Zn-dependent protease